jgi:hypothetical protein
MSFTVSTVWFSTAKQTLYFNIKMHKMGNSNSPCAGEIRDQSFAKRQ